MSSGRRLLVGTGNAHKISEIAALLRDVDVTVVSPADLGIAEEPEETGETFEANALIKARAYSEMAGMPCLADDSGLEIDALDGRPGIRSARYAPTQAEQIARVLGELEGVSPAERGARFVCVMALVDAASGTELLERGVCQGSISEEAAGREGFGYDPVFYVPELGKTMAEVSPEKKNSLSHRGRALRAMQPHLHCLFG